MNMHPTDARAGAYVVSTDPALQPLLDELRSLICEAEPHLEEAFKWGRLTFTANDNWHHWVCGLERGKGRITVHFHKGVLLDDPAGLLEGSGQYPRLIRFTPGAAIDRAALASLVRQAVAKQTDMPY